MLYEQYSMSVLSRVNKICHFGAKKVSVIPQQREFVIAGAVIFSQTAIAFAGDLEFVHNSEVSARRELTVTRNPLTTGILLIKINSNNSVGDNLVDDNFVQLHVCHWSHYVLQHLEPAWTGSVKSQASYISPYFLAKQHPSISVPIS